jgi:predicted ATPase/class 3 adenylate cyclase
MSSVALLFSDIEGSTRLLQRLGPSYAALLQEHHGILRHCFASHDGREQGTEGDSFFVVFEVPRNAVAAALEAQRALARHHWPEGVDLRVRMGVHTGEVLNVGDELIGMAIHEAARIMSSAHGGQVLASSVTATLADPMPDAAAWLDVGEYRLKDLPAPVHLMQLVHPDLRQDLPRPRSQAATGRTNLPAPTTNLVGRDGEADEVRSLVRTNRLVTLTGAGGAGKTRLAERVAAELVDEFPDGVWLAELALVTDERGIATVLASAIGAAGQTTAEGIATVIGSGRALVVVDNCEHLVDDAAAAIETLLRSCPNLTVLATSREPLGIAGEIAWRVPSLSSDEAVALFVTRAEAADPRLVFDDVKRSSAATICERLDGIPLAIELAAARLPSLGIDQLADRLDNRFRLLTGGRRGGLARQRTLQAAVDWSYDLLADDQKRLLRWLGAFMGGFPLEGAESVGEAAGLDVIDVVDHVDALVQKSLVVAEERDRRPRYRLLETIRQYALDRLLDGGELVGARDAHVRWVVSWCHKHRDAVWNTVPPGDVYERLEIDAENIRTAIDWALETDDVASAYAIGAATPPFWFGRGHPLEGNERLLAIAARDGGTPGERLAVLFGAWICANNAGVPTTDELETRMDDAARAVPPDDGYAFIAPMVDAYRVTDRDVDLDEKLRLVQEQLEVARATGHAATIGMTLQALAWIYIDRGEFDEGRRTGREMIRHCEQSGLLLGTTRSYFTAAQLEVRAGESDAAWDLLTNGLVSARETGDHAMAVAGLQSLAELAFRRGDSPTTMALGIEAIDLARRTVGPMAAARIENLVAWAAVTSGGAVDAFAYAELAVDRLRALPQHRDALPGILHTAGEAARLSGRSDVAVARHLEVLDIAIELSLGYTWPAALAGLAAIAAERGDGELAARLLGAGG